MKTTAKDTLKSLLPYAVILILAYYALPLFMKDTGTAVLMLLTVIPLICLGSAFAYGILHGFQLLLTVLAGVLFIPSIFIYYNESAWPYAIACAVLVLLGNAVGTFFHNKR